MKRAREGDDETHHMEGFEDNKNAKKMDVHGINMMKDVKKEEGVSHLALGVFDFPWLKDGVASKLEDYLDFEDNFSSFLDHENSSFKPSSIHFSEACCFETPEAKLEDIAWKPFECGMLELEVEDVDCIWASLLNQPL